LLENVNQFTDSLNIVAEIYAKNAGIIGKIHGAINEANPANRATKIVGSVMS